MTKGKRISKTQRKDQTLASTALKSKGDNSPALPESSMTNIKGLVPVVMSLALVLMTLTAYIPAMRADFCWDDDVFLTANPLIHAKDGLRRFWFTTEHADYFPLTSSMLWIEWRLWGRDATGYHVVNIILHIISSLLVWRVVRRLKVPGAWFVGLVFAVHPVNAESVAWITERKNTLPMVFYLSSILIYLRFRESSERQWYAISLALFVLALLSKTSVVMLPFVLVGCVWWRKGRLDRQDLLQLLPFLVVSVLASAATLWFQHYRAIAEDVVRDDVFLSRLAVAGWAVWFYLYKALMPLNLSFVYPRWNVDISSLTVYLPGLLIPVSFGLMWFKRRTWGKAWLFGAGYFVVTLFPVLGFVNIYFMKYSLVADHWQYTSIVGIIALVVGGAANWLRTKSQRTQSNGAIAGLAIACILTVLTWNQACKYRNEEVLWKHTLALNPKSPLAHNNLGCELAEKGKFEEAFESWRGAIRLKPDYAEPFNNIGHGMVQLDRFEEALTYFQSAVSLMPEDARYLGNLASAQETCGNHEKAEELYRRVLKLEPGNSRAMTGLAGISGKKGAVDQAIDYYSQAIELSPENVEARKNLAVNLLQQGQVKGAIEQYSSILKILPKDMESLVNIALAYRQVGELGEAFRFLDQALEQEPDDPEVHSNLGLVLADLGDFEQAEGHILRALEIDSEYPEAYANLGIVLARRGESKKALVEFRKSIELNPDEPRVLVNYANALRAVGEAREALEVLQKAIEIDPQMPDPHFVLGNLLKSTGKPGEAIREYQNALELRPEWPQAAANLAWVLATCPEEKHRDKQEAIRLAEFANQATLGKDPVVLDTLAAAYANAERFEQAQEVAKKALKILGGRSSNETIRGMQYRMQLYMIKRPYRDRQN